MGHLRELSHDEQVDAITSLASHMCKKYFSEIESIELVNFDFNATFKVTAFGSQYAFRINVNSSRTLDNVHAEITFVNHLLDNSDIRLPHPVATPNGDFVVSATLDSREIPLNAVMYTWLPGEEVGESPTEIQLFQMGSAMALMHMAASGFTLPTGMQLPRLDDFLWGTEDFLFSLSSELSEYQKDLFAKAKNEILEIVSRLYLRDSQRVIHADLHGWNVMWHDENIAVFDFDDSGWGIPIQDLATALYYLDTEEQNQALLNGYSSVRNLPHYTELELSGLYLQRRLLLLNYLYETSNHEHKELLPEYLEKTVQKAESFLSAATTP